MKHSLLVRAFVRWLPLAVALTGVFGFSYVAVQQNYRQSMNDPQLQMAEDAAAFLSSDYTPAAVVPRGISIDMTKSLAPWITVYDASGIPLESNAVLGGAPPQLPAEMFDISTWRTQKTFQAPSGVETRVTWQPRPDVRQAVVLVRFQTPSVAGRSTQIGWVAVGRSMSAAEDRISNLTQLAAIAWSTTVLATFAAVFFLFVLGWM